MKMLKQFFVLVFFVLFCFSCSAQTITQGTIFFYDGLLGVVVNNRVQFYWQSGENEWTVASGMDFNI